MRMFTLAAALAALPVEAQQSGPTYTWKMATGWASGPLMDIGAKGFAERIGQLSGGRFKIQTFPGGALGNALKVPETVKNGVAECGHTWMGYDWGKDPTTVLFGGYAGTFDTERMLHWLYEGGGAELQRQFRDQADGVVSMPLFIRTAEVFLHSRKPVKSLADLKGLKLRTAGGAMDITANDFDAVPVRMPGPDILPSLSRGTLDGTLAPLQSVKVFDIQTQVKHMTTDVSLGSFITVYAISDRAWKRLPEALRANLTEAGDFATKNHCEYVDTQEVKVVQELEQDGVKGNTMAPGQLVALNTKLQGVANEWAESLDKRNKPGSIVLRDFRKAVGK